MENGTLSIAAGDTSSTITIANIIDDTIDEPDETVIITLSSPNNATLGSDKVHTYTITDDDGQPTIEVLILQAHLVLNLFPQSQ